MRLEFKEALAERVALRVDGLELGGAGRVREGLEESLGIAVEGLPGEALLGGPSSDIAPRALEDSGGIGDPEFRG